MAQTLVQTLTVGRQAGGAAPGSRENGAGGVIGALKAYLAAQGAAIRTSDALDGHHRPADRDLKTLGIEHTPAYSAVIRH